MMTGMGANIHLHLKQQKRKETIPSIHARKTPKKNQFFVFGNHPNMTQQGYLSKHTMCRKQYLASGVPR